jgi:hypothetical protein
MRQYRTDRPFFVRGSVENDDNVARNGFFKLNIATVSRGTAFFVLVSLKNYDSIARNGYFRLRIETVSHGTALFVL